MIKVEIHDTYMSNNTDIEKSYIKIKAKFSEYEIEDLNNNLNEYFNKMKKEIKKEMERKLKLKNNHIEWKKKLKKLGF